MEERYTIDEVKELLVKLEECNNAIHELRNRRDDTLRILKVAVDNLELGG